MSVRRRVVVVGSLNLDLIIRTPRIPRPGETILAQRYERAFGGKGANQAVAASAAGADTVMIGAIGGDAEGRHYAEHLRECGVETRLAVVPGEATGLAIVSVDDDGENSIMVVPGANAEVDPDAVSAGLADLTSADVVLLQLEVPLPTVIRAAELAQEVGARVVLNLAPYADLPADVLAYADPIVGNQGEVEQLVAAGLSPVSLVTTLGYEGASWGTTKVPAAPVARVVDTTGAGDAFCGGLAAALASGADRESALSTAAALAAVVVGRVGAQAPIPRPD